MVHRKRPTLLSTGLVDQHLDSGPSSKIGSRHPVVQQIREEFSFDTPGVAEGLSRLYFMNLRGEEITIENARACIKTYIEHHARRIRIEEEKAQRAIVYYMRLGNLVKIGWTTNLDSRRADLNPQEVMATEPGGREVERERHKQFADLRIHGEWFSLESPLVEWIDRLKPADSVDEAPSHMISTKDATRIYKVPYSKLRLWADEGRVCAPERRGRELFWNPEEIEQMLELLGTRKRLPRGNLRDVG